jgi:hypothetical protein
MHPRQRISDADGVPLHRRNHSEKIYKEASHTAEIARPLNETQR